MGSEPTVTIVPDPEALADAAARLTVDVAAHAIATRGRFMWALAGGETPRTTYDRLALPPFRERVDWRHTWVFFGDERAVPPDHAGSNYRMAHEALLSRVPIPAAQVLRIRGEAEDLEVAAAEYARALGEAFGTRRGALPRFDLVLLGLGVDGHTASLFPDSPVVREVFRAVAAVHVAAASIPQRLTLTLPVFNAAARVVFLVAGAEKAKGVKTVLGERPTLPAAMGEFARIQPPSEAVWERFAGALSYVAGDPADASLYPRLERALKDVEATRSGPANRLFYCATPPSLYDDITANLGASGLARPVAGGFTRIIIEKPFGRDYASAQALGRRLAAAFREEQVYRIDHYLGKETVQNILVFRFANGIFEPLWNRNHVAEVQLTVAESIGVETRGAYYEEAGALRDMMQNHLLQLLCLIAMEPPATFDAGPVRDEKNKVMHAIRPFDPARVREAALRGQYGPGFAGGKPVPGYLQEKGVAPDSKTETYAALRLLVDNWRWAGVPFYLRTGKRLAKRVSEIAIRFHRTPHMIFRRSPAGVEANTLVIRIQPDEGIALTVAAKTPGPDLRLGPVRLDFRYGEVFGGEPPEAYERLLLDAIHGDATLYARGGLVGKAGELPGPVLDAWAEAPGPPPW